MKKLLVLIFALFTMLSLTSCKVNWFGEQIDTPWYAVAIPVAVLATPWYAVAIPVAVLAIAILIIGKLTFSKKKYICPECKTVFAVKWWEALFALHYNSDRVLKCPHCGRCGFCKVSED